MIKPFNDCDFCVTFQSECSVSRICHGWEATYKYINSEACDDSDSLKILFDDQDSWTALDSFDSAGDARHVYDSEIDEGVQLTITRISEY